MSSPLSYMSLSLVAVAALALGGAAETRAQPSPPPAPPPAVGNAPAVSGRVQHLLITPFGEVDGLLLDDGIQVHIPPHMTAQTVAFVRPGDTVTVDGVPESMSVLRADALTNARTGASLTVQPPDPSNRPLPPHLRTAALKQLSAQGRVSVLLTGPRGEVNGVLLSDGSIVRFPPPAAFQFRALLKAGQSLAAQGYGSESALGRALEATALGASTGSLQQIYQGGPPR